MIVFLRIFFIIVLVSMLGVTSWASTHVALWKLPADVWQHPWFIATLFDAYWGFFTFYLWLAWREKTLLRRLAWFIAIVFLGNIAMAIYVLMIVFRLPTTATVKDILMPSVD
jgi:hypothetical protein